MSKALTLSARMISEARARQAEALSSVIVLACGGALILAGQPLPY